MRKLLWSGLLALPLLSIGWNRAAAWGNCPSCTPFGCFPVINGWWQEAKICAHKYQACRMANGACWTGNSQWPGWNNSSCGSCGSGWGGCGKGCGSCGGWGCGCASCLKSCLGGATACCGNAPGPWYTYWPTGPDGPMTSAYAQPGWVYDMHFQTPAPIYPYGPSSDFPSYWVANP
jgi:hypothetical protein